MTTSPAESIVFTCAACGFHAKLAHHYQGKAIRCPGCTAPQLVGVPPPAAAARRPAGPGRVAFDCVTCNHHAEISAEYAGKVVWCPGCNAVQIVPRPEAAAAPAVAGNPAAGEASAEGGFLCHACGFRSRAIPSGVNGVVYCLACRAPQSMVRPDDSRATGSAATASRDLSAAGIDALADAIGSITPVSLDDPLTPAEHAALAALAAPTPPADPTPTPATQIAARVLPASARTTGEAGGAAAKARPQAKSAEPKPAAKGVEPANPRTTSVQVSQRGVRKVYRRVDDAAPGDAKPVKGHNDTTGDTVQVPPREMKQAGLLGRLTGKLFRRK